MLREGPLTWVGEKVAGHKGKVIGKILGPAPLSYPYHHLIETREDSDDKRDVWYEALMGHTLEIFSIPAIYFAPSALLKIGSALMYLVGRWEDLLSEGHLVEIVERRDQPNS